MTSMQTNTENPPVDTPQPGIYKHYKGNLYQVFGMARHSETEEWLVVYQALYGEKGYWVRPLTIWLEPVVQKTDTSTSSTDPVRFQFVSENDVSLDHLTQNS